jgi:hypothetical protein
MYVKDNMIQIQALKDRTILPRKCLSISTRVNKSLSQQIGAFINRIGASHSSQKSGDNFGSLENRTDINVFVVDTGISPHSELNIVGGRNFTTSDSNSWQSYIS